jgi:hypothetical protein
VEELDLMIFETAELQIARAVEQALRKAGIRFDLRFERPSLREGGVNSSPKRFWVAKQFEAAARELIENAVVRRARVKSLQPKPEPTGSGFGTESSGFDFGYIDVGGGDSGGDGGGCD